MKLAVLNQTLFDRIASWFATLVRHILNVLVVILTLALVVGVIKTGVDLYQGLFKPVDAILQVLLLDAVVILALVEIIITTLAYLKDGRVHVRFIVDTVLIIMLNEVVRMWFKHPNLEEAIALAIIIAILAAVRVSVTRWAPQPLN